MKKYIRIRNSADGEMVVSRLALEKLGLSTKRDNPNTIGQFGSGIKFAPIAALRNGWEWWFVGHDNRGSYQMKYSIRNEDGIDCVWYDYGHESKPSSFTIGAGQLSWTDPFQIIREPIANAIDGVSEYGGEWEISIVDEVEKALPFCFDVYITAAPDLIDIVDNIDLYFSTNREVIHNYAQDKVLSKIDSKTRIYSQDVLVYKENEMNSVFDYWFGRIPLNEERTVKSQYDLAWRVSSMVRSLPPELVAQIIKRSVSDFCFEWSDYTTSSYTESTFLSDWDEVFTSIYGENAVIVKADDARMVSTSLKLRNLDPVVINSNNAFEMLRHAGVRTHITALGEDFEYDIDDEWQKYSTLSTAVSIARIAEPGLEKYISRLGVLEGESGRHILGLTINMNDEQNRRILVSKEHVQNASVSDMIATLIHEYDHASTGIGDGISDEGRSFRNLADNRIGRMIEKNFRPNPFFIEDGVVCFRVSDMAMVGGSIIAITEHVRMLDAFLMKIGNFILKVSGDDIEENFGHEHQPHFSQNATVVSYPTFFNVEAIEVV